MKIVVAIVWCYLQLLPSLDLIIHYHNLHLMFYVYGLQFSLCRRFSSLIFTIFFFLLGITQFSLNQFKERIRVCSSLYLRWYGQLVNERFYRCATRDIFEGNQWNYRARRAARLQLRIVYGARVSMRILFRQAGDLSMAIEGECVRNAQQQWHCYAICKIKWFLFLDLTGCSL